MLRITKIQNNQTGMVIKLIKNDQTEDIIEPTKAHPWGINDVIVERITPPATITTSGCLKN